jgi:glutathionylspermidine synthase
MNTTPLYNGQPILFSLNPVNLNTRMYEKIEITLTKVLKEVELFTAKALKDKKLLRQLGVPEDLDPTPTPLGIHIPFARFDFIITDQNEIKIMELNTDGTSNWNLVEWLANEAKIPEDENPNFDLSQRLFEGLKLHSPKAKEIFLLDFNDVMTSWEQEDLVKRWNIKRANPEQRIWNEDALIYRRAVSWDLRQKAMNSPFVEDWQKRKIKVIGGWSSDIGMSKAWPAILNLPQTLETKLVDASNERMLKAEKDSWVLKKKFSSSGRGVVRGIDVDEKKWAETLRDQQNIVAQKYFNLSEKTEAIEYGMYFINGKASGVMARVGHKSVINDTSNDITKPVRVTPF